MIQGDACEGGGGGGAGVVCGLEAEGLRGAEERVRGWCRCDGGDGGNGGGRGGGCGCMDVGRVDAIASIGLIIRYLVATLTLAHV